MRSMAGEIPVYQEPTNGSIWGNVLEGGVDHILIMDRCVRLAYQVIMPWSILNYPYVKAAILSTYNEDPCGPCIHPTISVPSNTTISSNKTELSFPENTTTEIPNQIAPAPTDNITISGTYYSLIYGATTPTTPGNISANLSNNGTIPTTDIKQINNTTKDIYTPLNMYFTSYLTSTETNLINSTRNYTSSSWNKQKSNITNSNRTKTAPTRKLKFNIHQQHRPGTAQSRYRTQISQSNITNSNRTKTTPTRKLKFNIHQQHRPGTAQSQYHTQISQHNRTEINDSKISNHTTLQTINRTIITLNKTTSLERPELNYQLEFEKASASNRTKNHAEYSGELSITETYPTGGEQGTLLPVLSLEDGTVPIKVIIHFPHTHKHGSSVLRSEYIVLQTGNPKYHGHMESTIVPQKKRRPKKPVFIESSSSSSSGSSSSSSSSSSKTSSSSSSESDEVIGLNSQNNEIVRDRSRNRIYHGKKPSGKEQRKQKWRGQHLRTTTTTTTEKPTTPSQPFYEEKNIEEVFETKSNNVYLYRIENDQQTSTTEESQHSQREHKEDDDTKQEAEQKAMYDDQSNYAPSYENYQPILTEEENKHSHREHKEDDETRQEDEPKAMYDDQSNYAPSYENYQPVSTEVEEKHSQREHKAGENTRQEGGGKHHHKNKLMVEEGLGQSETQPKNVTSVDKSEAERNMLGKEQQNRGEKDKVLVKERDKVQDQKNEQIVQENQNEEDLDSTRNTIINHYSKLLLWLDYPL